MTTTISIHRALQQLKTLDSRISTAIRDMKLIAVVRGDNKDVEYPKALVGAQELETTIRASLQSVDDLISQRQKIKAAIAKSNAQTIVKVAGVNMTVVEAIEAKRIAQYKSDVLAQMVVQSNQAIQAVERLNAEIDATIKKQTEVLQGRNTTAKVSDADTQLIQRAAEARTKPTLVDPLNIKDLFLVRQKELQDFLDDVDATLSESNALTTIEV